MARDRTKLHPILQYKIDQLIKLCEANGLKIGIGECVRTVAEQDALYAKGRTAPGGKVTNAKGSTYSSMHQWGIAFDFYRNDGKGAYNTSNRFFERVGELGKSIGLEWGGDWTKPVDRPHFQLPYWGSTPYKLKIMYGNPSKFDDNWIVDLPIATVKYCSSKNDVLWIQQKITMLTNINICIDGVFGPCTSKAISRYQKSLGWKPTGVAGTKTIVALKKNRIK